jgi:hypothetical protein
LIDSIDQKKKLDEGPYLFSQPAPATTATTAISTNGNGTGLSKGKDDAPIAISSDDAKDKSAKVASQKRGLGDAASNGKRGLGDSHADEPPSKKRKDGQKAKSGSLHVPVEEGDGILAGKL